MLHFRRFAVASLLAACAFIACAQEAYPSRPLTVIVPFPPGGVADTALRALQPSLQRSLGQPVVISNRAGAGGAIGAAAVAQSKPDGYTVLFTFSTLASLPEQAIVNRQAPVFTLEQLTPVARVTSDATAIVVRIDSPYRSAAELLAAAKARPGELTYASSGNYGPSHLPAAMLADAAGVRFNHIPYTGGAQMISSLLGGQVDFAVFSRSLVLPHVEAGKLKYLASYGADRWTQAPVPPSLGEIGLRVDYTTWIGAFAPVQTPPEVLQKLRSALRAATKDPEFVESFGKVGGTISYLDGADFQRYWNSEVQQSKETIRKIGRIE
ncbi:Bug family tripartite tricarboxylate transporter substrate binding protein [Variovorax saccharolyticus]|uniref:Bug family tripartite tricarboxylate transporter substrate binding protein n=1 Tax=Variovorax saccharolyticus TaxID=3053516 RepID=UPI002574DC3C|nr:tripartite tricarboxylate transporter substrate binding protein [Variovorax sp. J31P216]MDM0026532.1 tripartite tricarboxylate transporter substrate binding protein [Variovorax sp. J31P216]